jgi:hypothetical protein
MKGKGKGKGKGSAKIATILANEDKTVVAAAA